MSHSFSTAASRKKYQGEDRALIPSPKVATYDLKPSMSAAEVAAEAVKRISSQKYDVIILNFANCDMVGHTGVFKAAVEAVETVDACVGKVTQAVFDQGGIVLITADHGNAEQMIDPVTKGPFTAHTTFPVPLIVAGAGDMQAKRRASWRIWLATMLQLMGIAKPEEMTGKSLIC